MGSRQKQLLGHVLVCNWLMKDLPPWETNEGAGAAGQEGEGVRQGCDLRQSLMQGLMQSGFAPKPLHLTKIGIKVSQGSWAKHQYYSL